MQIRFILLFLIAVLPLHAQLYGDIQNSWQLTKDLGVAIVHPSSNDLNLFLLGTAGIITAAVLFDDPVRQTAKSNQNKHADNLFNIDRFYGNPVYTAFPVAALYGAGYLLKNNRIRLLGLHSAQAYILTSFLTVIVKELTGRARPFLDKGPYSFKPLRFSNTYQSFFSGHSSTTFALSAVLAHEYDSYWWKGFWYGAAALVASARVYHDQHWLSDVIAGSLVGYAVGQFVNHWQAGRKTPKEPFPATTAKYIRDSFILTYRIPIR